MDNNLITLIEQHSSEFEIYYKMLVEWNEKFNLTAITEREEVYTKHFADSILGSEFIPDNAEILDVGAGAGFPSLPLKIVRPDIRLTMIDSLQKRIIFLQTVTEALNLQNVSAIHARAEDFERKEGFDVVVARAVAPLNVLCEYCLPFVKKDGIFLAYKADGCESETAEAKKAIEILGGDETIIEKRKLDEQTVRSFVVIKKSKLTPSKYPRGKNLPRKNPL